VPHVARQELQKNDNSFLRHGRTLTQGNRLGFAPRASRLKTDPAAACNRQAQS
jgi:hypothetical protein